jgi:NitT/TauT family transport system substrate-binding protein
MHTARNAHQRIPLKAFTQMTHRSIPRIRKSACSPLLALLLALGGFTGSGCDKGGTTVASSATTPASDVPVVVHLGFFPNLTHAAALVGTGNGSFQKALGDGVKLEERTFTAGPAEIEALFAGEVDLGYLGPGPAINGYLKSSGKALQIIAGASSGGAALVARQDAGIASLKDLTGKRVAVPQTGGTQDISLRHALQTAGLAPKNKGGTVDVVQFAPADTLTLFKQKQVDAAWVPEPWAARLEAEAGGKVVVDERTLWPGGRFSTTVVIARTEFLQQHADLVEKFLAAHVAAVDAIKMDPDGTRRIIGDRIKELSKGKAIPEPVLKTALSRTEITYDPLKESVLTFADWSKTLGYQRQDRSALTTLFDEAPLKAALGSAPGKRSAASN